MNTSDFRPPEEHTSPAELEPWLNAVRDQPIAQSRLDFETMRVGWLENRRRRRFKIFGLAAAAVAALWFTADFQAQSPQSDVPLMAVDQANITGTPSPLPLPVAENEEGNDGVPADDIRIQARSGSPSPIFLSARHLRLEPGRYHVDLADSADSSLLLDISSRTLEVKPGAALEIDHRSPSDVVLTVEQGVAAWIEGDSKVQITEIARERFEPKDKPSAKELAREAERHLVAGRTSQAIRSLSELVTKHRRSDLAPTALIDLARLLQKTKRNDEARCAYRLFEKRWPHSSLRNEIKNRLNALGPEGPQCRGLRPLK